MSVGVARFTVHLGRCNRALLQNGRQLPGVCGVLGTQNQIANLQSVTGELGVKIIRPKPFPYAEWNFNGLWQYWDRSVHRMNENSKLIVVEGNLAVGKKAFAKKLAEEFDMRYIPEVTLKDVYTENGFDKRELNYKLPADMQHYDLEMFYTERDPKLGLQMGMAQLEWYMEKYRRYCDALEHLLSTGQGVVLDRGVFSDHVFADALRKIGFLTPAGKRYYDEFRANSIFQLWKPHLVIYLDAPVSYVREAINERGIPYEVNGKNLTNEYLQTIEDSYKNKYLPLMRRHSEVMVYDLKKLPDWDFLIDELVNLDLEGDYQLLELGLFSDWIRASKDRAFGKMRMMLGGAQPIMHRVLHRTMDFDSAPELFLHGDRAYMYTQIMEESEKLRDL